MSRHAGHGPLVAFTSLAIAGAGVIVASVCLDLMHLHLYSSALVAGVLLQAGGLAVSLAHLGQVRRAALAMRGAGRSALSNEVILAPLALACGALVAASAVRGRPMPALTVIAGVVNALFLLSIGLVYRVRGQRTWQGASAFAPLTAGCAFGAIAIQSAFAGGDGGGLNMAVLFVLVDAAVFVQRWRDVAAVRIPAASLSESPMSHRNQLLGARFALLNVLPPALLLAWPSPLAAVVAAAGLLVDRAGFYALAFQHTTEHEVAAVEDLMTIGGQTRKKGSDS
jgi:DMSO reductase anchor subunit